MDSSAIAAASAMTAQAQSQQTMALSIQKTAHKADMAMAGMLDQAMEMVKVQQAPAPAGMGANVDKMA